MLNLPRDVVGAVVDACRMMLPVEGCGVVVGSRNGDPHTARVVPMANVADQPRHRFQFDAGQQLRLWQEMDERGEEPLAVYHSHPAGEAKPSADDIRYHTPDVPHMLIVSFQDPDVPQVRAWRINPDRSYIEDQLVRLDPPDPAEELERYRRALQTIVDRFDNTRIDYHPDRTWPTEASKNWSQGFRVGMSTLAKIARDALDPAAEAAADEMAAVASLGTDREWFDKTGNCGACGNPGDECGCDGQCGCGPHELRTTPRRCWTCKGTGWNHPRGVPAGQQVAPVPVDGEAPA